MYNIVKNVLNNGRYDLTDIMKKINSLWVQGSLTDSEYEELTAIARGGAKVENSTDVIAKLEEIDKRLTALENGNVATDETEQTVAEYIVGKWYYNGDKCTFEGKTYTCIAPDGVVCVWSPKDYPTYWDEVA